MYGVLDSFASKHNGGKKKLHIKRYMYVFTYHPQHAQEYYDTITANIHVCFLNYVKVENFSEQH